MTKTEKRYRSWFIQLSYDFMTHDKNGKKRNPWPKVYTHVPSEHEWKTYIPTLLTQAINQGEFLYIFHDKDKDSTGTLKNLHVHIVVKKDSATTRQALMSKFGLTRSANCLPLKNKVGLMKATRYLLHVTDKSAFEDKKHIYDIDEVHGSGTHEDAVERWYTWASQKSKTEKDSQKKTIDEFVLDLEDKISTGQMRARDCLDELTSQFGNVGNSIYAKTAGSFMTLQTTYLWRQADKFSLEKRLLRSVYIFGQGGVGKSGLAKSMAKFLCVRGLVHTPESPQQGITFDPAGTYQGENASVINDVQGGIFSFNSFNTMFDPTNFTPTGSRQHAMPWTIKYAFFTSSENLDEFIYGTLKSEKNSGQKYDLDMVVDFDTISKKHDWLIKNCERYQRDSWQIIRRLPILIEIKKISDLPQANIFKLNYDTHKYELSFSIELPSPPRNSLKIDKRYEADMDELGKLLDEKLCFEIVG